MLDLRNDFCSVPALGSSRSLQSQHVAVTHLDFGLFLSGFQMLDWTMPGDLWSKPGSTGYVKFLYQFSDVALPSGGKA